MVSGTKVCIYCRVAHNDSFSLEVQKNKLLRYAEQLGHTVICVHMEYGSGMTLDRPELQRATETLLSGQAEMLIVMSMDRIGRIWDKTEQYINLLTEHGIKVLCAKEGYLFSKHIAYDY